MINRNNLGKCDIRMTNFEKPILPKHGLQLPPWTTSHLLLLFSFLHQKNLNPYSATNHTIGSRWFQCRRQSAFWGETVWERKGINDCCWVLWKKKNFQNAIVIFGGWRWRTSVSTRHTPPLNRYGAPSIE